MTIASEITKLNTNLTNSYTACQGKGATMPANQNFDNLATCINTIPSGTTPTGTLNITQNGTYDVTNYASANVSVSGGGGSTWQVVEGIITNSSTGLEFSEIYDPNSEHATSGSFIYLVFDNGTLLFATPAYKSRGTLIRTGVLDLVEGDYYARCYTQDEISIFDGYSFLEIQGYDELGNKVYGVVGIEWTDPTA